MAPSRGWGGQKYRKCMKMFTPTSLRCYCSYALKWNAGKVYSLVRLIQFVHQIHCMKRIPTPKAESDSISIQLLSLFQMVTQNLAISRFFVDSKKLYQVCRPIVLVRKGINNPSLIMFFLAMMVLFAHDQTCYYDMH